MADTKTRHGRPPGAVGAKKQQGGRGGDRENPRVIRSTVDPKLVERRRQVRAEARRRRIRNWIILGAFAALVALCVAATMSPLLDVDKISVKGNSALADQDIARLSGVAMGDHLVSLDLAKVRSKLLDDPRIASARVSTSLPGTVEVRIIEEVPLLEFAAQDGYLLVSETGRVITAVAPGGSLPASTRDSAYLRVDFTGTLSQAVRSGATTSGHPASSPKTSGPSALLGERPDGVLADATLLVRRLPRELRSQVSSIDIAADRNVTLRLTDGADVKFGQPDEIEAKVLATRAVLSQVVLDCMKSIDVREPTRAAVSRGPGCPGISPAADEH